MKDLSLMAALAMTRKAGRLSQDDLHRLQQERLAGLLRYARENSPYYREKFQDIPPDAPLSAYPVTTKQEMMEHFDSYMTDPEVTREKVDRFMADVHNVGKKFLKKYLVYTTSGSTGNPCIVLYDDTSNNVSAAIGACRSFARPQDFRSFLKQGGKTMALFADGGFYLASGSVHYNLRKMPWKKRQMRTFEVRRPTKEIVQALNEFQPSMLGCYPSALQLIAGEQEAGRLHIHPAIIMTGGEKLTEDTRDYLSRVFGCWVQTNYSCTEGGTLACECTHHHFHINEDWVILEAVDEQNRPVPFGTQSSKVLLTNLYNKVCPFIRFEITDRVVIHNTLCPCGKPGLWLTLEGRTDDILVFSNGVRIAPMNLYAELKEVHSIRRFQLTQKEADLLELRLLSEDPEAAFREAKKRLQNYLLQNDVTAEIHFSKAAPEANPISGKFQHIIAMKK